MAAAPVPQQEELEAFSPSLFLDLSPTPHDDDDPNNDDLLLPFISHILMEEDIDDKFFYQYPDHPALLNAQQPYAQILDATSSSHDTTTSASASGTNNTSNSDDCGSATNNTSNSATNSTSNSANAAWPYDPIELSQLLQSPSHPDTLALPDNHDDVITTLLAPNVDGGVTQRAREEDADLKQLFAGADNVKMLNMAFLKGREEANKFLPTNNTLFAGFGGSVRLKTEPVVDETTFMFGRSGGGGSRGRKNNRQGEEDDLEAETGRSSKLMLPDQEDTTAAREMFDEIMLNGYEVFIKGMTELRIAMDSEAEKKTRNGGRSAERAKAVAVDLHTLLIHCAQAVATGDRRSATELLKQIKEHSSVRGDATQRLASCFAEGLEARLAGTGSQVYQSLVAKRTSTVDFLKAYKLFTAALAAKLAAKRETAGDKDLHIDPDEVLVVNDLLSFSILMDDSVFCDGPSPRDVALRNISRMKPDVFIQGIANGSHGASFLSRFRGALLYYQALFDMLYATTPRESELRLALEKNILGPYALNAIACEGADLVERPEKYRQWQARNHRRHAAAAIESRNRWCSQGGGEQVPSQGLSAG